MCSILANYGPVVNLQLYLPNDLHEQLKQRDLPASELLRSHFVPSWNTETHSLTPDGVGRPMV